MRKILLIVLIVLLLIGAGFTIVSGFELGNFQIWGIKGITSQNENIDNKNKELSGLVSVTYPGTLDELKTSSETLASTKQEYENKAILVSNSKYYMQTEKYEIEFLWTRLGNYAKDNNVQITIDVVKSDTSGLYNLKFTIVGEYSNITEFIYDVENDSKLGFKIEDFNMLANGDGVQGTFFCKDININIEWNEDNIEGLKDEENVEETENTNTEVIQDNDTTVDNTTNTTSTNIITEVY